MMILQIYISQGNV